MCLGYDTFTAFIMEQFVWSCAACVCSYSTVPQKIEIKLPLSVNKFMEAAEMDGSQFFGRWKLLSQSVTSNVIGLTLNKAIFISV